MPYNSSFDLLVDGKWRCEVKTSRPTNRKQHRSWFVNFHRHGKLSESVDLYIVRLEEVPEHKYAIHMLIKAPVGIKTMAFSMRSLIETAAPMVKDFRDFSKGQYS